MLHVQSLATAVRYSLMIFQMEFTLLNIGINIELVT